MTQPDPSTPAGLKAARHALELSVNKMAAALGVASRNLRRWEKGTHDIPEPVTVAVEHLIRRQVTRQEKRL